jgi:tRNA threonylcarbamoyl adenosine modification protein (Sua5/YciO/YrdC/YwlC family)
MQDRDMASDRVAQKRALLMAIHPDHPEPYRIQQAIEKLETERVIVYPTDTIYGLGADSASKAAIARIYALRGLDEKKPLSLVCASLSEASRYAVISDDCHRVMRRVLPGPYTFILRATKEAPKMGDKKRRTVGIRIPKSAVALALVSRLGRPLLSASAIIEGALVPSSDPLELADAYGAEGVALVLDAGQLSGVPSSIIDWTEDSPVIVRKGAGDVSVLES